MLLHLTGFMQREQEDVFSKIGDRDAALLCYPSIREKTLMMVDCAQASASAVTIFKGQLSFRCKTAIH